MTSEIQAGPAGSETGGINTKLAFRSEPCSYFLCVSFALFTFLYKKTLFKKKKKKTLQ